MILPSSSGPNTPHPDLNQKTEIKTSKTQISPPPKCSSSPAPFPTGVRISTCSFNLKETFQTSADELYRTFINQEVQDRRIEMRWRFRTWPSEHYATISLALEDRGDETELSMECRGVPAGEEDTTREGWSRFYFQAIKQTFGY
ncbi:hypothetical protein INR49_006857 [Caranx melampygus]|nr:hypothetical protein INR49_006857 [Caranx melampygus]